MSKKKYKFKPKDERSEFSNSEESTEPEGVEESTEPEGVEEPTEPEGVEESTEPEGVDESTEPEGVEKKEFITYKVRVIPGRLKYFSGPGTNYKFLGLVKRNDILTILEEMEGNGRHKWGRVKILNLVAWVPLEYCA